MKKKIFIITCLLSILMITGCEKNTQTKIKEEPKEVWINFSEKLLNTAISEGSTFFYLVDDGSDNSARLKSDIESIAKEKEYSIYIYDYQKAYNKAIEKRKDDILDEKNQYLNTYCEKHIMTADEVALYDPEDLEKDENGAYFRYHCSLAIAKNKDSKLNIDDMAEPEYVCNICNEVKNTLLDELRVKDSTALVFMNNGQNYGEINNYYNSAYYFLSVSEKEKYELEVKNNLENWFNKIISEIEKK